MSRERRSKRVVFILLTALLSMCLLEAGSWAVLSLKDGRLFSPARYQRDRRQILAAEDELFTRILPPDADADAEAVVQGEMLHPFVGFVESGRAWGVLEPSPIRKRAFNTLIVGVVGGSVAQLTVARRKNALERALRRSPRFKDKDIQILDLALQGGKEPQQLMMLSYLLAAGGELDVLINIDGFNDVALHPAENLPKGVSHLYPREWAERVAESVDSVELRLRSQLVSVAARRRAWASTFSAAPLAWSMTANAIWSGVSRRQTAELMELRARLIDHKTAVPNLGPPEPFHDEAGMFAELVELWKRCSIQLDRLCRANGIRYYHFLQPNQYVEGSKPMGRAERSAVISAVQAYRIGVQRGYPLLRKAGAELAKMGVQFHDLTMLFADHPEPLYSDDCCHYTDDGDELMAQTVGQVVASGP